MAVANKAGQYLSSYSKNIGTKKNSTNYSKNYINYQQNDTSDMQKPKEYCTVIYTMF